MKLVNMENKKMIKGIKTKYVMGVLIFLVIILVPGCLGSRDTEIKTDKEFHTGSEGIEMEIFNVPEEMFHDTMFNPSIKISNKGAFDQKKGKVIITVNDDDFCLSEEEPECPGEKVLSHSFEVKGKSVFNPIGEFEIFDFGVKAKKLPRTKKEEQRTVGFKTCYQYATTLKTDMCIDASQDKETLIEKACEVEDISTTDQGAPIVITGVEIVMHRSGPDYVRPGITLTVSNAEDGKVIKSEKIDAGCSGEETLEAKDWNTINLDELKLMNDKFRYRRGKIGNNIKCMPDNEKGIRLTDGEVKINCVVNKPGVHKSEASFVTQLAVQLSYGYIKTESKEIVVKNPELEFK